MVGAFGGELVEQGLGIAEFGHDHVLQLAVGLGRVGGGKTLPEEAVVPDLRGVVEEFLVAFVLGSLDHVEQRGVVEALASEQAIGLVDIGLVVFAVMIIERFGGHEGR